jgi:hypothetical protein
MVMSELVMITDGDDGDDDDDDDDMITILYVVSIIELMILERPPQQITVRTTPLLVNAKISLVKKIFFWGEVKKKKAESSGCFPTPVHR